MDPEKIHAAHDSVSDAVLEGLGEQAKRSAVNMILMYGDKGAFGSAGAYIVSVSSAVGASLLWLLTEGYVELTEKGKSTELERAKRRDKRENEKLSPSSTTDPVSAYL